MRDTGVYPGSAPPPRRVKILLHVFCIDCIVFTRVDLGLDKGEDEMQRLAAQGVQVLMGWYESVIPLRVYLGSLYKHSMLGFTEIRPSWLRFTCGGRVDLGYSYAFGPPVAMRPSGPVEWARTSLGE